MSYKAIRDAIATRLAAISNVGVVHKYIRLSRELPTEQSYSSLFTESGRVNVWMITRTGVADRQLPDADNRVSRRHTIQINVFWALDDTGTDDSTSEHAFQDAIDAVLNDFRTGDRTLGGAAITHSLPEVPTIDMVTFLSTLCHHAEIRLQVEEVL